MGQQQCFCALQVITPPSSTKNLGGTHTAKEVSAFLEENYVSYMKASKASVMYLELFKDITHA